MVWLCAWWSKVVGDTINDVGMPEHAAPCPAPSARSSRPRSPKKTRCRIATAVFGHRTRLCTLKHGEGQLTGRLRNFRIEFLNRIDEIVVFTPLSEDSIRTIARQMLDGVAAAARQKYGCVLAGDGRLHGLALA